MILRGPWFGSQPPDVQPVAYVDMSEIRKRRDRRPRPWHQETFGFGLFLTHELIVRLLARFQPHLRIAKIEGGYLRKFGPRIEPVKPEWDAPKFVIHERERQAHLAKQAAE